MKTAANPALVSQPVPAPLGRFFRNVRPLLCGALALLVMGGTPALALDPDSPQVKLAIERGLAYLDNDNENNAGLKALIGLTMVKAGRDKDDAKVQIAVSAIKQATKGRDNAGNDVHANVGGGIYGLGVCIMFLCALDPSEYRPEIEILVQTLHRRQKAEGAWGYPSGDHAATCDTSMTQYAMLGLWEAQDQAGVETPQQVWERATEWLIRTQDPSGGFGYQGNVSNSLENKVAQQRVTNSMTAAGMCSLYIALDQAGLSELKKRGSDDTPDALKPFEDPEQRKQRVRTKLDTKLIQRTRNAGDSWMNKHFTVDNPSGWLHYYLYALERYESFREADLDLQNRKRTPRWYDMGSAFLVKTQEADGKWSSNSKNAADTCFAILFLLRSTKKSLEKSSLAKLDKGLMIGGRGFPATGEVRLRDGVVVVKPLSGEPAEILAVAADPSDSRYTQAVEALQDLAGKAEPGVLREHSASLARLAVGGEKAVRVAAVRAITRSRNLDQCPALIYLLNEEDLDVMLAARDGLRIISRKPQGFGPSASPTADERAQAIAQWKDWYRSIRPDADVDFDPNQTLLSSR